MEKITVIGTGLIGTSLALAVKRATKDIHIVGYDVEHGYVSKAHKMGAVDKAEWTLPKAVMDAAMVIIATPVKAVREVMEYIAPHLSEGCVVTDTGSTKAVVLQWASEILPNTVSFVGGHPMAGRETSGPEGADATLFEGRTYCVIPGKHATEESVETVIGLVNTVGAKPYFISAKEHDSFVAAVSHLPLLLSVTLVGCTSKSPSWDDMSILASTGYKDLTRLASGDAIMHRDICLTNVEGILHWIDVFINELGETRSLLIEAKDSEESLEKMFVQAREAREKWLAGIPARATGPQRPDYGSVGERLGEMLMGRAIMDRQRRLRDAFSTKKQD